MIDEAMVRNSSIARKSGCCVAFIDPDVVLEMM